MLTRRNFLQTTSTAAGAALLPDHRSARARGPEGPSRIGLIGCGGRGTGAAAQALKTKDDVRLVAMGDAFAERLTGALGQLTRPEAGVANRVDVPEERRFVGFDAFQKVILAGVDAVILATPPHFRPAQIEAAVTAGKHIFFEKPVAVDGPGVRTVLAAGEAATKKGLSLVCGLQRHYQNGYREALRRVDEGAIGRIVAARCYWRQGGLWMHRRKPEWSDMEWQLRNWLYFTWLSGDHIVEQHVHNLDVVNWAKHAHPVRCFGLGGRQVRTDPAFGHIYDHHSVHYEFADGSWMFSQCAQIEGTHSDVTEHLLGTRGQAHLQDGAWSIESESGDERHWKFRGEHNNPYQTEHDEWIASIRAGKPIANATYAAESTLTAVMGRMATYSGKVVTWEEALQSKERLGPERYEWGALALPPVPMPGQKA